ncbi:cell wall hydrolase [Spirulina subsalsa FACHB-351]|uniref:Cell wall hydrolase n=1 Tax=Spirulina subsalsa FACHB-351 TaxID=234711 RepID=A0ABT3L5H9_9CYAN|nr:cell wall hydrolase [Spirulina subsalsa]MCW6036369.1 cell wall hydrolase [Spirulina subsalsa FACHB-351]
MLTHYKVKTGESLSKIARDWGLSLPSLLALNPQITNPHVIQVNDVIHLPSLDTSRFPSTRDDLDIMARTIFGEARGESELGQIGVGWVIMNRVGKKTWYGRTVGEVCLKPWQFSCWNSNDVNHSIIKSVEESNPVFKQCRESAEKVLTASVPDPTGGATHYHANSIARPTWAKSATFTVQIGNHLFYLLG